MVPDWAKMKPVNSVTTNNTGGSKMITQEMIDSVITATALAVARHGDKTGKEFNEIVSAHVINAVYPLILEQAAKEAEQWGYAKTAAEKIRNLKDETDEAHNG